MKFETDTGYGRVGEAAVHDSADQTCSRCHREAVPCLVVNNSEGEYRDIALCRACIDELFNSPLVSDLTKEHP